MYLVVIGINSSMRNSVQCIILLLVCGVIGAVNDQEKSVSVYEGGSVTLNTDTNILKKDKILWRFEEKGSSILLVEMFNYKITYDESTDERLRDRLQISNTSTGDLTIKNMRVKYSGLYTAEIQIATGTSYKRFSVTVKESPRVTDAEASDVKSVSVTEGESVTLHTDVQTQEGDLILWRFGDKNLLIAKGDMEDNKISVYDDDDGRFSGRLKLDKSGNLTITNIRTSNTGVYNLKIISSRETKYKTFSVSVSAGWSSGAKAVLGIGLFLLAAVFVAFVFWYLRKKTTAQVKTAMEGESLTLKTGLQELQSDFVIEWIFGDQQITDKVTIKDNKLSEYKVINMRFKDKAMLKEKTGDLIIHKIKTRHCGLYKVKITRKLLSWSSLKSHFNSKSSEFHVIVQERIRTGQKGKSVTLDADVPKLQKDEEILWTFGSHDVRIARCIGGTDESTLYDFAGESFKESWKLNHQTGDLTITNITAEHTVAYEVQICRRTETQYKKFKVAFCDNIKQVHIEDNVTLPSAFSELQTGTVIQWMFNNRVIISGKKTKHTKIHVINSGDQQFSGRLKLGDQDGSLKINKILKEDTGLYEVKTTNNEQTLRYQVNVCDEKISVIEGGCVNLPLKCESATMIQWKFNNLGIMAGNIEDNQIKLIYSDDQQFGGRLEIDYPNHCLKINNISKEDTGLYEVKTTNNEQALRITKHYQVDVFVSARTNSNEPEPTARDALLNEVV